MKARSEYPYPGLRSFERDETDIFFGRDEYADQLVDMLGEKHFIAVLGKRGCGKSSLVRTGLLGGLETGFLGSAGTTYWRITEFRPGDQPVTSLANALLSNNEFKKDYLLCFSLQANDAFASLQDRLRQNPLAICEIMEGISSRNSANLLILIDQFEEIFTQTQASDEDELKKFIDLILESCKHPNIYVVITMRSTYMDDCTRFFDLPKTINQGVFLTPRLTPEQLREAIIEPASIFGDKVDEPLVERLLHDMGDDPDNLPLLQDALAYMWRLARAEQPGEAVLNLKHYDKIGGLAKALSTHAEEIYNEELDRQPPQEASGVLQKKIAQVLFRRIITRGEDNRYIRHPAKLNEVAELAGVQWEQVAEVVGIFRKKKHNFLTPQLDKPLEKDSVLDVSHESLIRYWERLKNWTDAEAEFVEIYRRLEKSAQDWEAEEEDKKYEVLWYRYELDRTVAQFEEEQPSVEWAKRYDNDGGEQFDLAMRFFEASKEKKQKEQQKEMVKKQKEQQQKMDAQQREIQLRWMRRILAGGMAVLGIVIGLAIWGFLERNQAVRATQQAEEAKHSRTSALFDSQLNQARLLIRDENYAAAKRVLEQSHEWKSEISLSHQHARDLLERFSGLMGGTSQHLYTNTRKDLYTLTISPNGRLLAAGGENGVLILFAMDSNQERLHRLKGHTKSVRGIVFDPKNKWLASAGEDGLIIFWSLSEGEEKNFKKKESWKVAGEVWAMAVNPDGTRLASGGDDKNITLRDTETGEVLRIFKGHEGGISSLAFDPAGDVLASASDDNTVQVWDVKTGEQLHMLTRHTEDVEKVIFSPDGRQMATSGLDGGIRLWEVQSGSLLRVLEAPVKSPVFGLQYIANGRYLVSGGKDGKLRFWDIQSGVTVRILQGHKAGVNAIAGHAGKLFSTGNDGAVMGWNTQLPYLEADLPSEPASTAIAPDGNSVAVGFADGMLRLYFLPSADLLWEQKAHESDIQRLDFNADGSLLASAGLDYKAKLWQIEPKGPPALQATIVHKNDVSAVAFATDSRILATGSYDGRVGLFTIGAAKKTFFLEGHKGDVNSIAFSPDGTQLLSGGDDGVLLWNVKEAALLQKFPPIQDGMLWVTVSPDGRRFAAVGRKPVITVYSFPDGNMQHRLSGHEDTVLRAEFSPDGQQLASVSGDATIRFWDLHNGAELFALRLPARPNPPAPLWDFD
ncbi:MAG: PQQ-binding-like beta-propeller repeat protein, partial [Gammaproteobacteria bacterium]|nr:PQQ-binding-like beta-propeller repeat protein [Gammaproteobacteria bacterium]